MVEQEAEQWRSTPYGFTDGVHQHHCMVTPDGETVSYLNRLGTHLQHCNFGELVGLCKYGSEDECPALSENWRWFGKKVEQAADLASATTLLQQARGGLKQMVEAETLSSGRCRQCGKFECDPHCLVYDARQALAAIDARGKQR